MKKKVAAVTVAVSLMLTGAVSAANLWGTYKGNEIIRITSNGVAVKPKDVPAISYNGRTMIPISMLGQLGLNYTWNQSKKTVNFNTKANTASTNDLPPVLSIMKANMFKDMEDLGEELFLTKAAFDLDFISKMSSVTFDSNSDKSLANAIDNYNALIGRLDVAALT
ncbi:stalk domain-containing protein [Paenibacillus sp. NFR01]|uniref:stalk domain-containing protein n=1 Tax=Paenibacillus sp. NFR01 TaxID=1566279 RepID=UPI0008BF1C4E|nr:stalk domain-containing protein [Paenibacillus sp. NFR01]SET02790.1 Copper amine oxidase N-terminal domain-containing protein [Paenibacillus sp. NFR01]